MKKLNLDDFKSMADGVQTEEVMSQIDGGLEQEGWYDCHGFWGGLHKLIVELVGNIS